MIEKVRRDINVIASDLKIALKRETADIIAIGDLLLEAQEQVEHGEWLTWLKTNFGSSIRTAQNYMNAARFASKYAPAAHLKLRPSALYFLGNRIEIIPADEREAIFKAAETEWVTDDRAFAIITAIHEERNRATDWESAAEEQQRAEAEARSETDDILDGPPPELPPSPPPAVVDTALASFDEVMKTLLRLYTKSPSSFAATTHEPERLRNIAEFLHFVADAAEQKRAVA